MLNNGTIIKYKSLNILYPLKNIFLTDTMNKKKKKKQQLYMKYNVVKTVMENKGERIIQ